MSEQIRGYDGSSDIASLRDFITASAISDADLAFDVYCKMLALNQSVKNADAAGMQVRIIRAQHIWMNSDVLMFSVARNGADVEFFCESQP
jgi:hypothetical protein